MFTQKLVLSYGSKLIIQFVQIVTGIIVSRIVGPTILGYLAYGLSFVSMFAVVNDLGMGTAHIKLISQGEDEGNCNSTYLRIRMILLGVFVSLLLGTYAYQKLFIPTAFESQAQETVVLIYMVIVTLSQLITIPTTTWAGKMQQAKQDLPSILQTVLYQILRLILAVLGFKAVALATSNLVAVVVTLPIYVWLARDMVWGKFDKVLFKKYLAIAGPMLVIVLAQTIIYSTDKVLLQYFTNSKEVGYYSAAFALSQFIRVIESSVGMLFFPYLTKFLAEQNYSQINNALRKFERFSLAFILPFVSVAIIAGDLLIRGAYGNKFLESIPIFSVITLSFFVSMQMLPYGNLILGSSDFKGINVGWITSCIIFVIATIIFVHPSFFNLKGVGSALAILTTNAYLMLFYAVRIKRRLPELSVFSSYRIFAYTSLLSVGFYAAYKSAGDILYLKIGITILFLAGIYGLGTLLKVITKEDWGLVGNAINIKKMKEYIRSEFTKRK